MPFAMRTVGVLGRIGVNTHIDFRNSGYQNLAVTEAAINYLGIHNLRDSAQTTDDFVLWQQVARVTHSKFDDYVPEGSFADMQHALSLVPQLAAEHLLNFIEGGNEEDDPYAVGLGNTLALTAQFQQQVSALGHSLGLPVINMSFGAGWTWTNGWIGDYGKVGDLAAYADYGNAHTYPMVGQGTDWATQRLNGLAKMADSTDPVITTEIGWNESMGYGQDNIARFAVQAVLDGVKDGNAKTYFYALFNDASGLFGLMNQDGTPKPAGTAIHNLTTLLADPGWPSIRFIPERLDYTLAGRTVNDNTQLMEKSDGSFWLALWNEKDGPHDLGITVPGASRIEVFDPVQGLGTQQDVMAAHATITLSDRPLLLEITR